MEKNILYISFAYPPVGAVGSIRASKFTKYLHKNNWIPHVVAGVPFSYESAMNLQEEIPAQLIKRVPFLDPVKFLYPKKRTGISNKGQKSNPKQNAHSISWKKTAKKLYEKKAIYTLSKHIVPMSITRMPDRRITWIKPAYQACMNIISQSKIDLIFSSSSPPASAIVASLVQKNTGLPWVAEFRDLWSRNNVDTRARFFSLLEEKLEKKVLKNASALVTVSDPLKKDLIDLHDKESHVVFNGFDEDDFNITVPLLKPFTITYTGSIYKGKRDPSALFQAVAILKNSTPELLIDFNIRFFGAGHDELIYEIAKKYGVENYIECCGAVNYSQSIRAQMESSILLLLEWNDPSAEGVLTAKIFEYLAAGRPILAIGYPGEISRMLQKTCSGILMNDPIKISEFLKKSIALFRQSDFNLGFYPETEEIKNYSREAQTKKLIQIFQQHLSKDKQV